MDVCTFVFAHPLKVYLICGLRLIQLVYLFMTTTPQGSLLGHHGHLSDE